MAECSVIKLSAIYVLTKIEKSKSWNEASRDISC